MREAAQQLIADRYLLEEDLDIVIAASANRYDLAMATPTREGIPA